MQKNKIPEEWLQVAELSIKEIWQRFKTNPKDILTESDLKCWLFSKLTSKKTEASSFAVHTEVTHYSKEENKNYRFRDLSLLTSKNIILNKDIYDKNSNGLSKGFKHNGCALHFELKFLRQGCNRSKPYSDFGKINDYDAKPTAKIERKFIALIGSHDALNNEEPIKALDEVTKNQELFSVYSFDTTNLEKWEFQDSKWVCKKLN
jgi:hypothetical protein